MNYIYITKKYWFIGLIVLIVALNSIIFLPKYGFWTGATDPEYKEIALSLIDGDGFSLNGEKTMFREPAYPFLLFLNYKIFGVNDYSIRILQFLFLFLICFLTYKITKKVFGSMEVKIATIFVALHPLFVIYATDISSEILAILLLIFFVFIFVKDVDSESVLTPSLMGLALALLVLTKSIFIFIPVFVVSFYLIKKKEKKIIKVVVFALSFLIIISPWVYRNYTNFGKIAVSERAGVVAYVHASKSELGKSDFIKYGISSLTSQYFVRLYEPGFNIFNINIRPLNEKKKSLLGGGYSKDQVDTLLFEESKRLWRERPFKNFIIGFFELAKANAPTVPKDSIMFVYNIPENVIGKIVFGLVIVALRLLWFAVILLSFFGIAKAIKLKNKYIFPLALPVVYLNLFIFFLEGVPRFLFPIYPLYFTFLAFTVVYFLEDKNIKFFKLKDNNGGAR